MNKRNCEKCPASYGTGKSYGLYWCQFPDFDSETKGLCERCNPNTYEYKVKNKLICTVLNCNNCERLNIISGEICKNTTREEKELIYKNNNYKTYGK